MKRSSSRWRAARVHVATIDTCQREWDTRQCLVIPATATITCIYRKCTDLGNSDPVNWRAGCKSVQFHILAHFKLLGAKLSKSTAASAENVTKAQSSFLGAQEAIWCSTAKVSNPIRTLLQWAALSIYNRRKNVQRHIFQCPLVLLWLGYIM